MAARTVKGLTPAELVVEAALQDVPEGAPVLEVALRSAGRIAEDLSRLQVKITATELEQQLQEAGFILQGSLAARRRLRAAPMLAVAQALGAAHAQKQPVFWAFTGPGPSLGARGGLDPERLQAVGLGGPGALLNVGPAKNIPGLVSAALMAWARGQRTLPRAVWLVTGGSQDPAPGRVWQAGLQRLADDFGLTVHVRHLPAGIFRWIKAPVQLARIHSVLGAGQTALTHLHRVYARRASKAARALTIDVRDAVPVAGKLAVRSEGPPALRSYRIHPRGR